MSQPKDSNTSSSGRKIRLIKKKPSDSLTSQKLSGPEKLDIQLPDDAAREANREKNQSLVRSIIASSLMVGTMMSGGLATIVLSPLAYFWLYAENQNLLNRKYRRKLSKEKAESRLTEDFGNQLPEFKHQSYYIFDETQPYTNKTEGIDFFFSPNPEQTMAFRVIDKNSIFSRNEKIQLFYDPKSSRLLYQKLGRFQQKQAPTPFKTNFIQAFSSLIQYFQKNPSDLVHHPSINIIVLTGFNQLIIPKNTSTQCLNGRHYLSVNDIYIVEESQFNTLIEDLSASLPPLATPSEAKPPSLSEAEKSELIHQNFPHTLKYLETILIFYSLWEKDYLAPITLLAFSREILKHRHSKLSNIGQTLSLAIREETDYRISSLLKEKFSRPQTKLYSILDNTKPLADGKRTVEMILHLSESLIFAISIKHLMSLKGEPVKVFYDPAVNTIRFRKKGRSKGTFSVNPIAYSQEKVEWLLTHRQDILPHPPIQIIVFPSPIEVVHHDDTPLQSLGKKRRFLHHEGVYIVEEKKLVSLIKTLSPLPQSTKKS